MVQKLWVVSLILLQKRPSGKERVTTRSTIGNYYKDYNVTLASEDFMISAGKEYSNKRSHSNDYPNGSETDWWLVKVKLIVPR